MAASQRGLVAWRGSGGSGDDDGGGCNGDVLMVGARSDGSSSGGGGTDACGGGGNDSWTPSSTFREQLLDREETPFFSKMMARVCGGSLSPLIEPKMG